MFKQQCSQVSEYLQEFFDLPSEILGRATGFVKRQSKLTTGIFVKTLVLGLLEKGDASLTDLIEVAGRFGVEISESGLAQRMNNGAEQVLKQLVQLGMAQLGEATTQAGQILKSFSAVNIIDSTQTSLPESCRELLSGSGGCASPASAKIQVNYEYLSGTFTGLELGSGRVSDHKCTFPIDFAQKNSLMLFDLGYFKLATLAAIALAEAWFLTRLHTNTTLYWQSADENKADIIDYLDKQSPAVGEVAVYIGAKERLPVRLVYCRLPDTLVAEKRRKARRNATKKKRTCSEAHLRWLAWHICITNVAPTRLSAAQVLLVYRLRWQIELVFKLWKSQAKLTTIRFENPQHVICLLYAHLLGLLLFQWLIAPHRFSEHTELSPVKAFKLFQKVLPKFIRRIALGWHKIPACLAHFFRELQRLAQKSSRLKSPSTYHSLLWHRL